MNNKELIDGPRIEGAVELLKAQQRSENETNLPKEKTELSSETLSMAAQQLSNATGKSLEECTEILENQFKSKKIIKIKCPLGYVSRSIKNELVRIYDFGSDGNYREYIIKDPIAVFVREGSTTHQVLDAHGVVHSVPAPGFVNCVIRWIPKDQMKPIPDAIKQEKP